MSIKNHRLGHIKINKKMYSGVNIALFIGALTLIYFDTHRLVSVVATLLSIVEVEI